MSYHPRNFSARCNIVLALLLAAGVSARASAQQPIRPALDSGAASRGLLLTAEQRGQFVGTYSVTLPGGERTLLYVTEKGEALFAKPGNQDESHRMLYRGDGIFAAEGMPDFIFHFVVVNGRATKFTVRKEDGTIEGVRIE